MLIEIVIFIELMIILIFMMFLGMFLVNDNILMNINNGCCYCVCREVY